MSYFEQKNHIKRKLYLFEYIHSSKLCDYKMFNQKLHSIKNYDIKQKQKFQ